MIAFRCRQHRDVAGFAELVGPLLASDPARNTLALTALGSLQRATRRPAALLTVHTASGELAGAAIRTANRPLIVSALPVPCALAAVQALERLDPPPGATGPTAEVDAVAAAVRRVRGARARVVQRIRLFELDELRPPTGVPGRARPAGAADVELLAPWRVALDREMAGSWGDPGADPADAVHRSFADGDTVLVWEVDGVPVAQAGVSATAEGMARVRLVYTPPEYRGRGYGSAVTAAATAHAVAAGARNVLLFTDLANPVSNAIYPRIGFRPVQDGLEVAFDAAPSSVRQDRQV